MKHAREDYNFPTRCPDCGRFMKQDAKREWHCLNVWCSLSPRERFWAYIDVSNVSSECWIWLGAVSTNSGYGNFSIGKQNILAHRFAYEEQNGPVPKGSIIRHSCNNPLCMRGDHLISGTYTDNEYDKILAGTKIEGEKCHLSVLSEDNVREIIQRLQKGEKQKNLAFEYQVVKGTISHIHTRRNWKCVTQEPIITTE